MTLFTFSIGVTLRAVGCVEIEAPNLDRAKQKLTVANISKEWAPHDWTHDSFDIGDLQECHVNWVSWPNEDEEVDEELIELDLNIPIPDDFFSLSSLSHSEGLVLIEALQMLQIASPSLECDKLLKTLLEQKPHVIPF